MSFLGKVLIVLQVVMSVLFMCGAAAVFSLHSDWRNQAMSARQSLTQAETAHTTELQAKNDEITRLTAAMTAEKNRADQQVNEVQQLTAQVATLQQSNNTYNQQIQRQTGIAETKNIEAQRRQEEAEQQRVQNEQLIRTQDALVKENQTLKDQIYSMGLTYDKLVADYHAKLEQLAFLEKVVRQNPNLETDPTVVAALTAPPPPVDGLVREIRKDKTNRTKYVYVSIGEDDGLRIGHELDVYRPADQNGGKAHYLGRIRIISLEPDNATGIVVQAAKNGIIERGDNVTTRL